MKPARQLLLLTLWVLTCLPLHAKTLVIASGEWPPFSGTGIVGFQNGLGLAIVTEAFKTMGWKTQYAFMSWQDAYSQTRSGNYEASGIWFKSPERATEFYFSDAVLPHRSVFFHLKDRNLSWRTLADLQDIAIGATSGYAYGGGFESLEKDNILSVSRVNSDTENFKKLLDKRIDVFPVDINVGYYLLKNHFDSNKAQRVTHYDRVLSYSPTHLIVSKTTAKEKAKAIIKHFNEGLVKIKLSGQYFQMLKSIKE